MKILCSERLAGILLGWILVVTSIPHILAPFRFLDSLLAYRLVSGWHAEAVAAILPWFQFIVGVVLITCRRQDAGWLSAGLLFGLFLMAQVSAVMRGLQIDCGCFPGRSHPVSSSGCAVLVVLLAISLLGLKTSLSIRREIGDMAGTDSRAGRTLRLATGGTKDPMRRVRRGWTLVEVLAVIGIIGTLLAFFLPAVQSVRESARQVNCQNRLRQLGLACLNYESARRRLPPGTLGFPGTVKFNSFDEIDWSNPSSPGYWKNVQHTSVLSQLLPYLEASNISDGLPQILLDEQSTWAEYRSGNPAAPEWIGDIAAVQQASQLVVPAFLCPSDDLEDVTIAGALAFIGSQPSVHSGDGRDWFLWDVLADQLAQPAGTNYLANAGAHGAGWDQDDLPTGFAGPFSSRPSLSMSVIQDGLSHTILFGESTGVIEDRRRSGYRAWMWGGLARGRGGLPWMRDVDLLSPQFLLFGDDQWSHPAGFGSKHPQLVNFVLADGSTRALSRAINLEALYAHCGCEDGTPVEIE